MDTPLTDVTVELVGGDGNAFFIIGKVQAALKHAGHRDLASEFVNEATSGDYNHVLHTCMKYVNVE